VGLFGVVVLGGFVFVWLMPWVFLLHCGALVYFPYRPNGKSRYVRVTGPGPALFGADWTPRSEIPDACVAALIAAEDAKFFEHSGLDWESLRRSYRLNDRAGSIKRGGSTITQQLVKNAFLSRNRWYFRKAREIVGALVLDLVMSKQAQLTWYLNVVEFGPNVYGIGRAARYYYGKPVKALSVAQCVELVAILPRPNVWNRSIVTGRPTSFFRRRCDAIRQRM